MYFTQKSVFNEKMSEGNMSFEQLFSKFCTSSTIHGTYFWTAAKTPLARLKFTELDQFKNDMFFKIFF